MSESPKTGPTLTDWYNDNPFEDNLLWKADAEWQIGFVHQLERTLTPWSWRDEHPILVVSTHGSKSVLLPVYFISAPGVTVTMRGNFHDWRLAVESDRPVVDVFHGLFEKDRSSGIPEGFVREWVPGTYDDDPSRFMVVLHRDYDVPTFFYLLSVACGLRVNGHLREV